MRKSIFTLVLFASLQMFSFAQQDGVAMTLEENIENIEKIIADKTDITGTFAVAINNQWEVFVDDGKVNTTEDLVLEIEDNSLRELLEAGLTFVQEDKTEHPCYRYRVVSEEGSAHKMYLFNCKF